VTLERPRPTATVTFTMQFISTWDGLDPHEPLMFCSTTPHARAGYVQEQRELWSSCGRLMARNQQTLVLIR